MPTGVSHSAAAPQNEYALCHLFTVFCLFLFVLSACTARGQDMAELEVDHALTFDFATPHTKWAQPYALGKVRVLFFADGRGTNPRECAELMQRFDLDAQAVFWARIVDSNDRPLARR